MIKGKTKKVEKTFKLFHSFIDFSYLSHVPMREQQQIINQLKKNNKIMANMGYLVITLHRFNAEGEELDTDVLFSQQYANHKDMDMVKEVKGLFPNLKWSFDDGETEKGSEYFQLCCYPCPQVNDTYFLACWSTDAFNKETGM